MRHTLFLFFNDTATTEIYTLSLHDALPISLHIRLLQRVEAQPPVVARVRITGGKEGRETFTQRVRAVRGAALLQIRSEEHTSELQSRQYLVCRLLLEKKTKSIQRTPTSP